MASEIQTLKNPSGMLCDVKLNLKKQLKGRGSTLEETRLDHAIRSAITATKLLLCCIILKN